MTISTTALTGAFKISGSNITLVYDRLTNGADPAPLSQSFYVSSSATSFYIKAIPTTVPTNPNVKFFLKTGIIKEQITPTRPLILNPISSTGVVTQREIIFEFGNAKLLPTNVNQHIFDVVFSLSAGELRQGGTTPTTPGVSSAGISIFSLSNPTKNEGCAPINVAASWVVNKENVNVDEYKLRVVDTTGNLLEEFAYDTATNITLNTLTKYEDRQVGAGTARTPSFTLQVIRKSDLQVVDQETTASGVRISTGQVCTD